MKDKRQGGREAARDAAAAIFLPALPGLRVHRGVESCSIFAPAKLNLFLAITGRRADGFHDLVSVVAPLDWGDRLEAETAGEFTLRCDDPEVPVDESNLVLKAARAFAARTGWDGGAAFRLEKRIPMGAGLGGGSSDAVGALRALNRLAEKEGRALDAEALHEVASGLGSDCPLFLHDGPIVMRGRGERIAALAASAVARVRGRRVLVFKPGFGVATPWAYAQLAAAAPGSYLPAAEAEARLAGWTARTQAPLEELLFNNMEPPVFGKFAALPVLFAQLRREFGVEPRMSGSGSACFVLLREDQEVGGMLAAIRAAWGDSAFAIEARLA
jgi:4-diphosphocytidyl-2-C-methyl-D-erythritol kinase